MKHLIIILTICIAGCMSLFGQTENSKVVKQLEATANDYISLLNKSGYEAFAYDLSSLLDGKYKLSVKIKEYTDGNEICEDLFRGYCTIPNKRLLGDLPDNIQKEIKAEDMADPERGIIKMMKKLTIGLTPVVNDSIRPVAIDFESMGQLEGQLCMQPQYKNNDNVNGNKFFSYHTRTFKTGDLTMGKFIPLVLFGSAWYDEKIGTHRFCGEREINPDMSSEILKYIPHYYVIGFEVNPVK